jgi:hypothetical protein
MGPFLGPFLSKVDRKNSKIQKILKDTEAKTLEFQRYFKIKKIFSFFMNPHNPEVAGSSPASATTFQKPVVVEISVLQAFFHA